MLANFIEARVFSDEFFRYGLISIQFSTTKFFLFSVGLLLKFILNFHALLKSVVEGHVFRLEADISQPVVSLVMSTPVCLKDT